MFTFTRFSRRMQSASERPAGTRSRHRPYTMPRIRLY